MKTVKGDLIEMASEGEFDIIIHGCNCFHTMGSGIAAQIRSEYPEAYKADLKTNKGNYLKLGEYSAAQVRNKNNKIFYIMNAYTQFRYGIDRGPYENSVHVDYSAIRLVFKKIVENTNNFVREINIGFPMIGAGLAGGDWDVILNIIEEETFGSKHQWTLVEYEN